MNTKLIRRFSHLALLAAIAAGFAIDSYATGSSTADLGVSATVVDSCSIAAEPVAFGNYDSLATSDKANAGSVTVTCNEGASATITLGQGTNAGSGSSDAAPARRLADSGGNFLNYNLYQGIDHLVVWGNTSGTGQAQTGVGGAGATLAVYGLIPKAQLSAPAGSYSDTVVATVTF
jgi:spore coat protein U-like protein